MCIREREIQAFARLRVLLVWLFGLIFWTVLPASSQEVACGVNLIAGLEQKDPAKFEQIRAEAEAVPNGRGLLWKVHRDGAEPSYLFGTMHLSDERIVKLPKRVEDAFDAADTVIIETTDVLDRSIVMREFSARTGTMMFPEGESLTDHLTDTQQEEIGSWLEKRGVAFQTIIRMKPWMVLAMASQPPCETLRQARGAKILDIILAERAEATGKKVAGLETLAEQFEALNSFSTDFQVRALLSTAALGDKTDDIMETLASLYVAGETGMFTPAVQQLVPHDPVELDDYTHFEERVVIMRNRVMAERAMDYLDEGNVFIAVGALHLPGEKGLIELLRTSGWEVERAE